MGQNGAQHVQHMGIIVAVWFSRLLTQKYEQHRSEPILKCVWEFFIHIYHLCHAISGPRAGARFRPVISDQVLNILRMSLELCSLLVHLLSYSEYSANTCYVVTGSSCARYLHSCTFLSGGECFCRAYRGIWRPKKWVVFILASSTSCWW